jgi:segregation and condensation protein A
VSDPDRREQPSAAAPDASSEAQEVLPHVDTAPSGTPRRAPEAEGDTIPDDAYRVSLDVFEGPLDLLLHLIRKHELDILDIPIGFITTKYLEYLDLMGELQIDVASEYLVMAATLAHIKSKMLLPPDPNQEGDEEGEGEEEDPRAELVRRLLEYQKYKHVADQLGGRAILGRDTFRRGNKEPSPEGPAQLAAFSVFKLFDAFERVLKRANQVADHQVLFERVSLTERIVELTEMLTTRRRMRFDELFEGEASRMDLVMTFLALLEMCKMRVARIAQDDPLGELFVELPPKTLDSHHHAPIPTPERSGLTTDDEADDEPPSIDNPSSEPSGSDAPHEPQ